MRLLIWSIDRKGIRHPVVGLLFWHGSDLHVMQYLDVHDSVWLHILAKALYALYTEILEIVCAHGGIFSNS